MIETSRQAEEAAVLQTARAMCAAARTAPKTRGVDMIDAAVVTGAEKDALAQEMLRLSGALNYPFMARDAQNVKDSAAVVLIGTRYGVRGMNEGCAWCGFKNCQACKEAGGTCVYDPMDLGIAAASAAAVAAAAHIDNRIMFSIGRAALSCETLGADIKSILGLPLSATGKSPYFDRAKV